MSADHSHAWASVLGGITGQQIAVGLNALVISAEKWPPTAPEFRGLCIAAPTAESLGLPTEDQAYAEACRKSHPSAAGAKWSHEAVYHAATETGFFNLTALPMDASRKLFCRNYAITVRLLIEGKPLKAMPLALPEKVDGRVTEEGAKAGLSALRKALAKPSTAELPPHLAHLQKDSSHA
ncbi:replication protein P [Pseudomonas paeninsulae]|uniref:replication protein P n=1 Tax=Pseudomonas paeninsulae TaxID=3110772 RepID=UPI002D76C658|nr:replication protein P [Pseudomonas sp. IT1137]